MKTPTILIADIGGTNARFALASVEQPYFVQAQTLQCAEFENVEQAIDTYLNSHQLKKLDGICFAVAGPIVNQNVKFTNNHWHINSADLKKRYAQKSVHLLNDFESIAFSLPRMRPNDLIEIGGRWKMIDDTDFTVGVAGPGTGLGITGLCQRSGKIFPLITEGGHSGFAPEGKLQIQVLEFLHNKLGRVSNERLLSGPGLMNIHEALCEIHGRENPGLSTSDIAIAGTQGNGDICQQSVDLFFEVLGQVAGDLALTMGAYNGIFIAGGITQRYPEYLVKSKFRESFENKGRHSGLMKNIPSWLIKRRNPGLMGASHYMHLNASR